MEMTTFSEPERLGAWKSAVKECEAEFSPEDLEEMKKSTGPDDILDFIEEVQVQEHNSKLSWLTGRVRRFGRSFKAYDHGLDLMAQGTPFPGCLIWGSIRIVVSVSMPFADVSRASTSNRVRLLSLYSP